MIQPIDGGFAPIADPSPPDPTAPAGGTPQSGSSTSATSGYQFFLDSRNFKDSVGILSGGVTYQHLFIDVTLGGRNVETISAYPRGGGVPTVIFSGGTFIPVVQVPLLTAINNLEIDGSGNFTHAVNQITQLHPTGSGQQFLHDLETAAATYNTNKELYSFFAGQNYGDLPAYDSNGFIHGLLRAAGDGAEADSGALGFLNFVAPGYNNVVPASDFAQPNSHPPAEAFIQIGDPFGPGGGGGDPGGGGTGGPDPNDPNGGGGGGGAPPPDGGGTPPPDGGGAPPPDNTPPPDTGGGGWPPDNTPPGFPPPFITPSPEDPPIEY